MYLISVCFVLFFCGGDGGGSEVTWPVKLLKAFVAFFYSIHNEYEHEYFSQRGNLLMY